MKRNPVERYIKDCSMFISCAEGNYPVSVVKSDGTVKDEYLSANKKEIIEKWNAEKNNIAVAGSNYIRAVLKNDGTVYAYDIEKDLDLREQTESWKRIKKIEVKGKVLYGLCEDGNVFAAYGLDSAEDEAADKNEVFPLLTKASNQYEKYDAFRWENIMAVSCSKSHIVGLRKDGTVVAVGKNDYGQCQVSHWKNIIAIKAGPQHTVGIRKDGLIIRTDLKSSKLIPWRIFGKDQYERYERMKQQYSDLFIELAYQSSLGDEHAMYQMYEWFKKESCCRESNCSEKEFYRKAACTWLLRAAFYGSNKAIQILNQKLCLKENSFFPEAMLRSGSNCCVRINGSDMKRLGFFEIKTEEEIRLHGRTKEGIYFYETYAGCEDPDEDGFGREEECNYHVYDEFFNYIYTYCR